MTPCYKGCVHEIFTRRVVTGLTFIDQSFKWIYNVYCTSDFTNGITLFYQLLLILYFNVRKTCTHYFDENYRGKYQ